MLKPVAQFESFLVAVLYHHENHDGSGYPAGIARDQIPIEARIIHVVDIFDALTTDRPYRKGHTFEQALRILRNGSGTVTDPDITDLFIETLHRYQATEPDEFRVQFRHLIERRDHIDPAS